MRAGLATFLLAILLAQPAFAADICNPPGACANATTTAEMVECGGKIADAADKKLNALWPKVMALYDGMSSADDKKKALREAQRTWIKFRDETCKAEYALADGGTIGGIYSVDCACAVTASRIADFERMIATAGN